VSARPTARWGGPAGNELLASTGYRFARYYARSRPYRAKGPPLLPLRLLGPVLVVTTVLVFGSGVWLMVLGHRSDTVLELHKVSSSSGA
jgi:hypothetical protein